MSAPIRVLHVDDDHRFAELTARFLERTDDRFDVETVHSVSAAIDHLEGSSVDCIVSDYDMPETNGIEFLADVRARYPNLPFILFTGKGSEQVASEAISAGVTDYLQKQRGSEQYELLANRLENAVSGSRVELELAQQRTVLSTVIENLPVGVLAEDESREILAINSTLVDQFGGEQRPGELVGRDCDQLAHELKDVFRYPDRFIDSTEACLEAREPVRGEAFVLEDGRVIERDYVPYDLPSGKANLWVYADVTDERERQRLLSGLFEQSMDGIGVHEIVTDDDGEPIDYVFKAVNERFETLTGLDADEIIDRRATEVLDDLEETPFIDIYGEVAHGCGPVRLEEYSDPLGRHYEISAFSPRRGQCITIFRDVTERKERERTLEQFKFFVEHTPDFMVIMEADLTVRYQSPVSPAIDYEPLHVVDDDPREHIHPDDRERTLETFDRVRRDPDTIETHEYRAKVAGGGWRWFESRVQNYLGKEPIDGILVTIREITERKRKEEQLKRQHDRLEEFASVVSHDLRNPLNIAAGRLELLEAECESDHFEDVAWAIDRMDTLIDDLLTLAREGDHVGNTTRLSLADLAEDAWGTVETASATLSCETTVTLEADRTRLTQLLENLYRNAVEHGGSDVTVTVGDCAAGGFYVADDGPGIPADQREHVFEAGFSTNPDGTGFGLAIVQQIATAHGWDVRATEGETGGARFEICGVESVE